MAVFQANIYVVYGCLFFENSRTENTLKFNSDVISTMLSLKQIFCPFSRMSRDSGLSCVASKVASSTIYQFSDRSRNI